MSYRIEKQIDRLIKEIELFCHHDWQWNRITFYQNKNYWCILLTEQQDTKEWLDFLGSEGKWKGRSDSVHDYPEMMEAWWSGDYISEKITQSKQIRVSNEISDYMREHDIGWDRFYCTEEVYADGPLRGRRPKGEQLIIIE